jgi:hypothetical protein
VNRLGRFVFDGVVERHDTRLVRLTAGQLQLEPLRRRLRRQQRALFGQFQSSTLAICKRKG